jgi:membrane-bound ClpP family serine protease
MSPWILLAIGFLLIFLEFYIPGAIMGVSGGVLVFVSIILFAIQNQSPVAITLYIIGTAIALGLLIKFALWRIRTAKPDYSIYSDKDQEGYQASAFDASAIGKKGIVITDLKPGGHIMIEGKTMQAISQSGYITKGSEVIVIGGQEESLIVKLSKKETSS